MTTKILTCMLAIVVASAAPVWAQHEGHAVGSPATGASAEQVTACVQSQQQAMALVDAANQRIERARQTNDAAAMRSVVDELQATLATVRSQLASCAQLAAAAPAADAHAGDVMPCCGAQPSTASGEGHAGHVMPAAPAANLVKDPRCREEVDPRTAPQASHEGRTDYFCSESDRQRFVANPAQYLQAVAAVSDAADPHAGHAAVGAAPAQAPSAQSRQPSGAGNLAIAFRTSPSPPRGAAENEFEVMVKDRQGKPVDGADVSVVLFMPAIPAMRMPEMRNEVKLQGVGNGRYTGKGQVMTAGPWTVTVSVRQKGKEIGQQKVTLTAK